MRYHDSLTVISVKKDFSMKKLRKKTSFRIKKKFADNKLDIIIIIKLILSYSN